MEKMNRKGQEKFNNRKGKFYPSKPKSIINISINEYK